jgi:hypothetical protein
MSENFGYGKSWNFFPKNCRGDKILSVYWFVILILVAGGVFAMATLFYGSPYDVRGLENDILAEKVVDCLSKGGRVNVNLVSGGIFNEKFGKDFLKRCSLTFNTEDEFQWKDRPQYYIEVDFCEVGNLSKSLFSISEGNLNLNSSCEVQKDEEYERLVRCVERRFYALGDSGVQYLVRVLSVVRKVEKNVR